MKRIAVALATGIFVAVWLSVTYFVSSPMIALTRCAAFTTDLVCGLNSAIFFAFYALWPLTLPALAIALSLAAWALLGAKAHGIGVRPAGVTLGVIVLAASLVNRLLAFWIAAGTEASGVARRSVDQTLQDILLPPFTILAATLAMVWLWQVRERGRLLALALLAMTLVIAVPTWVLRPEASAYPARSVLAIVTVAAYLAQLTLFAYLLMPSTRALFARPIERN